MKNKGIRMINEDEAKRGTKTRDGGINGRE